MDDDEDDFGDFGGFEAAEPVLSNVAQNGPVLPVEASPTPWATLSPDYTVGVKPDLLCGQNRFPPLLDPSVPVFIQDKGTDENNSCNYENDIMPDFEEKLEKVPDLDKSRLADNILGSSFTSTPATNHSRSEKSNSQPGKVANKNNIKAQSNIPDIQNDDTLTDTNNSRSDDNDINNDAQSDAAGIKLTKLQLQNSTESTCQIEDKTLTTDFRTINLSESEDPKPNSKTINEADVSEKKSSSKTLDSSNDNMQDLLATGGTDSLFEDLAYIDSAAKLMRKIERDSEQKIYTDHSNILNKELKAIRNESHMAVMTVIEEYKDLLKVNLQLQKERFDKQLAKAVEEQQKLFQQKFYEQQQKYEQMLNQEKVKMEEEYKIAVDSQAEKQQEQFDLYIQEEKIKNREDIKMAIKEESEASVEMVRQILKDEKSKLDQFLLEEMTKMELKLQKNNQKHEELMKEFIENEKEKSKEAIQKALENERLINEESLKVLAYSVKEEMVAHLEQEKQLDQTLRQRQLASLDVFLESARRQLTLLMESDSKSSESEHPKS